MFDNIKSQIGIKFLNMINIIGFNDKSTTWGPNLFQVVRFISDQQFDNIKTLGSNVTVQFRLLPLSIKQLFFKGSAYS